MTEKRQRRRGRGEGSIRKRSDGRWEARIALPNGKRRSYFGATRKEASEKLQDAQALQGRGLLVSKSMPLGAWLDRWLLQHVATLRPATVRSYTQIVRDHIRPQLGAIRLDKLTPAVVADWQHELRREKGARTCQLAHAVLRACLSRAAKLDLLARNVATQVTPAAVSRKAITVLDPEQARAFLGACSGHVHEALLTSALAIGLRQGEALGLQWRDVDLIAGTVTVRQQLQRIKRADEPHATLQLVPVKTRSGERRITLPAFAIEALRAHRQRQNEARLRKADAWHVSDFVFTSGDGYAVDPSNLMRSFRALLKAANLPAIRFHDLRHSCASLLLAQGTDPRTVQEILGHSDIRVTLGTYGHVMPASRLEAARRMDQLLG